MPEEKLENLEEIETLVKRLNELVPREGAQVRMRQYGGGPDESEMVANRQGYLRLGTEILRGAFFPCDSDSDSGWIDLEINYLVTRDSDIRFDNFMRDETLKPNNKAVETIKSTIAAVGCIASLVMFAISAIIGLGVIGDWIYDWFVGR